MGAAADSVTPAGLTGWEGLLKAATVRLEPPSGDIGTGFVIAEGLVATCAHVVAEDERSLPKRVLGHVVALNRELTLEPVPGSYVRDRDGGLDLILLRIADTSRTPAPPLQPVLTSSVLRIGDELWTYGHPLRGFRSGQSGTLRYQGTDLRSDRAGAPWLPHAEGRVGEGYSGSAVINIRTGAVCGMLSTSDLTSSAHLVPVAEILARCPPDADRAALKGDWPRRLSRSQLEAGGWGRATPLLRDYLRGAQAVADGQHPYPMIEGDPPRTLSMVYVSPSVGSEETEPAASGADGTGGEPRNSDNERIPAEELFRLDADILLVGAPGAGKSSLLRHAVTELAARWKPPEERHDVVPVRVDARDLAKKFPLKAMVKAVNSEILPSSAQGWPPEWFDGPPVPAARWLVLVDGLDEVGDSDARAGVIEKITELRERSVGDNYRFLVTTRPLPAKELPPQLRRFDLLPLDPRQLSDFATRWLTALKVDDPERAADLFLDRLEASGMTDPARTPLMASMLCQLFKADQDQPLPRGRSAVYREFVRATQGGRRWNRSDSPWPQLLTRATKDYGDAGAAALKSLRAQLPALLERLAYERHNGTDGSALQLLTKWSRTIGRKVMSEDDWAELSGRALPELLRACGLLRQRRDDFVFIHQTFAEYLTARWIAGNPRLSAREFRLVFGHDPRWPSWALGLTRDSDPAATSVVRFLVDAWAQKRQRGLHPALRRLAARDEGAALIATLVADGAKVDEVARKTAISVLHRAALALDHEAAVSLARMGDRRGVTILIETAERHRSLEHRLNAARGLADLGNPRGIQVLRAMAADPTADGRVPAAEELVRRGDPTGTRVLVEIARGPENASPLWLEAARTMVRLQLPEGTEALVARMTDTGASSQARILAAEQLRERYPGTVAETLAELIRGDLPPQDRIRALSLLRPSSHDPRTDVVLAGLAEDPRLPVHLRIEAARAVHDRERQERLLVAAASDPDATPELRLTALQAAPTAKGRHITDLLLSIVDDRSAPPAVRFSAVHRMPPSPEPRTRTEAALTALLKHPGLPSNSRSSLMEHTVSWWAPQPAEGRRSQGRRSQGRRSQQASPWWADTVSDLVTDDRRDENERRHLITQLSRVGARTHLIRLAAAEPLPGRLRLLAARKATALAAEQGAGGDVRLALVRNLRLPLRHYLVALAQVVWDLLVDLGKQLAGACRDGGNRLAAACRDAGRSFVEAVRAAIDWSLTTLLRLPFLTLLAVLPFAVAVAANAFGVACTAADPPEDWKLRVYFMVTALLVSTLYLGASAMCGMGREGRKTILYGLVAGAVIGLLRIPEPAVLNEMGAYLAAVIPWDREWQVPDAQWT
ncbi:trypsin-like peptidase domain-containing protein [Streptomyces sp. enrichment culture]|uniref:trypsin-like peptidase domain-containing protein n=1 Tax=Streptomyces sp. enrichment culture TaxID=1795815 RepID=UPI003F544C0B